MSSVGIPSSLIPPPSSLRQKRHRPLMRSVPRAKREVELLLRPLLLPLRSTLGLEGLVLRLLVRSEEREHLRLLRVAQLLHLGLLRVDGRLQRIELGGVVRLFRR